MSLIGVLPPEVQRRADHPGRKRPDDRKVLQGALLVPSTGVPGEGLPQEPGFGSGVTCRRRLRDWGRTSAWHRQQGIPGIRGEHLDDIHEAFL